ncbi:GlcG/HbpS family heme-binding protein [Amphritea pacifica]|uniref:Heme-binding protein n=1 Tax=Amphritea pacifica TaxID=2811233 RepID=A0ABS2WCN9_9GAMM|nr:heme-binding protein [Amphritea pacifica]MBN0989122.1 heme-binding protein [Amphritea pacifica]MBN1008606.1 heme-binding protein [Amphritea pacifica]
MSKTYLQASLTLDAAMVIAQAAINHGNQLGIKVNVVVVDSAGNRLVSLREPGAPLPAMDFAEKKAYTAANFRSPTEKWAELLEGRPIVANGLAQHPKVALFGGGLPVLVDGSVVGAVGVAGGKVPEDLQCAEAGIEALNGLS